MTETYKYLMATEDVTSPDNVYNFCVIESSTKQGAFDKYSRLFNLPDDAIHAVKLIKQVSNNTSTGPVETVAGLSMMNDKDEEDTPDTGKRIHAINYCPQFDPDAIEVCIPYILEKKVIGEKIKRIPVIITEVKPDYIELRYWSTENDGSIKKRFRRMDAKEFQSQFCQLIKLTKEDIVL